MGQLIRSGPPGPVAQQSAGGGGTSARMQAALARVGLFPPPAAGTVILAGLDGARARGAADARIASVVQHVVGQLLREDIGPDVGFGPVEQRTHLGSAVLVLRDGLPRRACLGLLAAQARDPGRIAGDGALEGLDLANLAAGEALLQAVVEAVDALLADILLDRGRVGIV